MTSTREVSQGLGLSNPKVQRLRRLVRRASDRREEGVVVGEGAKVIRAALDGGANIRELYLGPAADPGLEDLAARSGATVHRLSAGVLDRVASTVTPQSEIALVERPSSRLDELGDADLLLVGVGIQDPGNAGTMVRTALAAGASGILFSEGSVDVFSPKTVRSSAGAVFALPVIQDLEPEATLESVAEMGLSRVGTSSSGAQDLYDAELSGRLALVMGNEANGLPVDLEGHLDQMVRIPMTGPADSLNVAVASAVICFEAVRQRRLATGGGHS